MTELFATGRVVDLILAIVALEAALFVALRRRSGRGIAIPDLAWNLAAGCGLLLAVRGALVGVAWPWIASFLLAALVAHLCDLRRRVQSGVAARPRR